MHLAQCRKFFTDRAEIYLYISALPIPYQILSYILVQGTDWDTVLPSVRNLTKTYSNITDLAKVSAEEILGYLEEIPYADLKSHYVYRTTQQLVQYTDIQLASFETLITLSGIGKKTARRILPEVFGINSGWSQAHVCRVATRIGLSLSTTLPQIYTDLVIEFREDDFTALEHVLMRFGQLVCKRKNPACYRCQITHLCLAYQRDILNVKR